ncbi:hypothetical protein PflCFBP13517_25705 [Pseudomonas fluorescens]|nr:hypothetical protein PflCFBP13517_25705 [Pseudomonas fluorescens]
MLHGSEQGVWRTTLAQLSTQNEHLIQLAILPAEWGVWCRGEGQGSLSSEDFALAEHCPQIAGPQRSVRQAFDEKSGAWLMERQHFRQFCRALQLAGVEVRQIVIDVDLLPEDSAEAIWLAGRWLVGGELGVRLAVDDSRRLACAVQVGRGLTWPEAGSDLVVHDVRTLHGMVQRAAQATNLIDTSVSTPGERLFQYRYILVAWGLVLSLIPQGYDFFRAQQLEHAAHRLDIASVAKDVQRRRDRASLSILGTELKSTEYRVGAHSGGGVDSFQRLHAMIVESGKAQYSSLAYDQGKWLLEVKAATLDDIKRLQSKWYAAGFHGEIEYVRGSVASDMHVRVNLEQVPHS